MGDNIYIIYIIGKLQAETSWVVGKLEASCKLEEMPQWMQKCI